jgi:predicted TIM-barrel fold metal-dependent hydrolase
MEISRRTLLASLPAFSGIAAPALSKHLIIDAHCHAGYGQAMTAPWTTRAPLDIVLRHMEEAGIDRTVLFPVNDSDYEKPNQRLADMCERHPGKFIGFAKHDPETERGRIERLLRKEVEDLGLKGLKLHKLPTREVLDAVAALRIPIIYHPKHPSMFYMIAEEYPQITFFMAHIGCYLSKDVTWHYQAIDIARRYPNVYLETSGVAAQRFIEMAIKELGPEKVLFGSDGPENDSRLEIYKVRLLKLAPDAEAKVLGGNVQRLLPKGSV